ncbi:MAG: 16S rRNA (guanine(966)-N(2))-methyltransferase RsmD [Bacteroides sp.]|nr:16S rRNA (guanine(966)-N(2))-methyltransferase RsmD [Bacteroides sp.]MCM1549806.1 16S rRNA (guanine(966)-N(2))-methyltransferase RsmD [Clostridium sp.]
MRVIAGTARSLQLKTVPGMDTRPTTDRIKETLFNILAPELPDCEFLDLFSGSGGIGIEALSRGANRAYFVDNSRKAVTIIRENLVHTRLESKGEILGCDAVSAVRVLEQRHGAFDVIFMDPPYGKELEKQVLYALAGSSLAGPDTLLIIESDLETEFDYLDALPFVLHRIKKYKTNKHTFFTRSPKRNE